MRVLMVASENDALSGFKVGGIGDVLRDVPLALSQKEVDVDVVVPDYFEIHHQLGAQWVSSLFVGFRGRPEQVELYCIPQEDKQQPRQWLLVHPLFSEHRSVYSDDPDDRPFATDANKYALFSVAVCEWLLQGGLQLSVLHLHDWHAATVTTLIESDPKYRSLGDIHTVYTVHNIALQGLRPFKGDHSSFEEWFPTLSYDGQKLCDPRYPDCYNPVAAAINLCDKLHLVSPTYAQEVLLASDQANGYFGGEGLEGILANQQQKIVGILNGCEYDANAQNDEIGLKDFLLKTRSLVARWMAKSAVMPTVQYLADQQLIRWLEALPTGPMLTSIGRLTDQKVLMLRHVDGKHTALDKLLQTLKSSNAVFVMMGSGDSTIEFEFMQHMSRHDNFLFINGYEPSLSDDLYALGDMFLMPSSFEPCGISQMMALRAGQPCIVHSVGGLRDTVVDGYNGLLFSGENVQQQATEMLNTVSRALSLHSTKRWDNMVKHALDSRFYWADSMDRYLDELYQ